MKIVLNISSSLPRTIFLFFLFKRIPVSCSPQPVWLLPLKTSFPLARGSYVYSCGSYLVMRKKANKLKMADEKVKKSFGLWWYFDLLRWIGNLLPLVSLLYKIIKCICWLNHGYSSMLLFAAENIPNLYNCNFSRWPEITGRSNLDFSLNIAFYSHFGAFI